MNQYRHKLTLTLKTWRQASLALTRQFSSTQLHTTRNAKLRRLIAYAARHVKYYRELFDELALDPQSINSPDDLRRIPVLTRQQLRDRFWDFLPTRLPPCRVSRTSGSTASLVCVPLG